MFEAMGELATFTPATGSPVSCYVLLNVAVQPQPDGMSAQAWSTVKTIEYLYADIGREANRGETFTVDSVAYTVQAINSNDGLTVEAVVT